MEGNVNLHQLLQEAIASLDLALRSFDEIKRSVFSDGPTEIGCCKPAVNAISENNPPCVSIHEKVMTLLDQASTLSTNLQVFKGDVGEARCPAPPEETKCDPRNYR